MEKNPGGYEEGKGLSSIELEMDKMELEDARGLE